MYKDAKESLMFVWYQWVRDKDVYISKEHSIDCIWKNFCLLPSDHFHKASKPVKMWGPESIQMPSD